MSDFSYLADLDDDTLELAYQEAQKRQDWELLSAIQICRNETSPISLPTKTTLNAKDVR